MLIGRFGDTSGSPYVESRVAFPRVGKVGHISFLVDTGADRTIIMPTDGRLLQLDYGQLVGNVPTVGLGGACFTFEEWAIIVFTEPNKKAYVYNVKVLIAVQSIENASFPSLLGRDVLNRWRTVIDNVKSKITFTVRSADLVIDI